MVCEEEVLEVVMAVARVAKAAQAVQAELVVMMGSVAAVASVRQRSFPTVVQFAEEAEVEDGRGPCCARRSARLLGTGAKQGR